MSELCDLSAVELRRLIGSKAISPVELLASCRARIDAVNPALNAVTSTCWDRAAAEAEAAERAVLAGDTLGALHGLPIGIKDLDETEGLRTTFGSPIFADYVPKRDERIVAAVRRAGAVVVGKTNVPEWGAGSNTKNPVTGDTGNPFDPARICGGSSGGSAVALATGMLPLADGSDMGGSLRNPAAYCGVVGIRPSLGLVAHDMRAHGWSPLTTKGPMGRDVADTSLLLSAMVGFDARDPLSYDADAAAFRTPDPVDLGSLRVAWSADLGFAIIDSGIRRTFADRIARIAGTFAEIFERDPDMAAANETFAVLRATSFVSAQKANHEQHPELLGPNVRANYEEGLRYTAQDAGLAQIEQTRIYRAFQALFDDCDLFVCPTNGVPPFSLDRLYPEEIDGQKMQRYFHWMAPCYGITLTASPAISIPCGLDHTGAPFGLQLVAPRGRDKFLLDAAHALYLHLQTMAETARPLPDLDALAAARAA